MNRLALSSSLSACLLLACKPAAVAPVDVGTAFDAGPSEFETREIPVDAGLWFVEHRVQGETRMVEQRTPEGPTRFSEDTNADGRFDAVEERQYAGGKEVFRERREDRDFDGAFDRRLLREATPEGQQRRVTYELLPVDGGVPQWRPTREVVGTPDWQ